MWPRLAGSTRRKCGILEFKECDEATSSNIAKRKNKIESRKRKVQIVASDNECTPKSTFPKRSFFFYPESTSLVSPSGETNQIRSERVNRDRITDENNSQSKSADRRFSKLKPSPATPVWPKRNCKNRPMHLLILLLAYQWFRYSLRMEHSVTPTVEIEEDIKSEPNATPFKAKDESFDEIFIEASPTATPLKKVRTSPTRPIEIEDADVDIKSEPSFAPVKTREESFDDFVIEASQGVTPLKQISCENVIYDVDSMADTMSPPKEKLSSLESSSSSSNPRNGFFGPRRTVPSPPSPRRQRKRKLQGLAAHISSHLVSCRAERLMQRRDPRVKTVDIQVEDTVRCWGVSISRLSSNCQQLFCRRLNATVPASGPASFRLALPLAQVQIYSRKPPALVHPIFV